MWCRNPVSLTWSVPSAWVVIRRHRLSTSLAARTMSQICSFAMEALCRLGAPQIPA